MDNRHPLIVDCQVTQAEMRRIGVTPHVAQNTARLGGYAKSINARRGIEKVFGLHVIAYDRIRLGNLLGPAAMEAA